MKKIVVKQDGFKDCAVACSLSIIRYYNGDISKDELGYIINTTNNGTNAYDLILGLKQLGFDGYGMGYTFNEIIDSDIVLPAIAHVKSGNVYHYVVIYEINSKRKHLLIMDPASGMKKIKFDEFSDVYLNTLLFIYPISEIPKFENKISFVKYLFGYLFNMKKTILYVIILSILIMIFGLINSMYFKIAIDYILKNNSVNLLLLTSFIFIMIVFLKNIFMYLRTRLTIKVNSIISKNIMFDTIRHIMRLPYHYFKRKPTGEVTQRINNLESLSDLISNLFLNLFVDIFLIIISSLILYFISFKLFFISIICIVLYAFIVLIYKSIFKKKINNLKESDGMYSSILTENIAGYESIKNLNVIDYTTKKLNYNYSKLLRHQRILQNSFNSSSFYKNVINDIGFLIILSLGIYFIFKNLITLGDLLAFYTLLSFFMEPLKSLLDLEPNISTALSSYERINEFLRVREEECTQNKKLLTGAIEIENLSVALNGVDNIFENVSLKINEFDKILIYGKSGNGKSTLVKILSGYIDKYKGSIKIGSVNIKDLSLSELRNSFTTVSQNETLFCDTLENNIKLGRTVSDKEFEEILSITKVDDIRESKKFRNNFLIEENGFNLSGGEKQKIVLARALVNNFNYLIIDEGLSEVGFDEEREIINSIFKKYKNKTIIYISHKKEIINYFENKYKFCKKGGKVC